MRPEVNVTVGGAKKPTNYTYKTVILKSNLPFAEQVTEPNCIYVIKWDFELSNDVVIPKNCILKFDGGSISGNYTISGISYESIIASGNVFKKGCKIAVSEIEADWVIENPSSCNPNILEYYTNRANKVNFSPKTYTFTDSIVISNGTALFYGEKDKTVLSFPNGDGIVFKNNRSAWWNKYHTISNLSIRAKRDCVVLRPYDKTTIENYCVKDSIFENLTLTTETGYCIYNSLHINDGQDYNALHNNVFRNIRLNHTPGNIYPLVYGVVGLQNIFEHCTDSTNGNKQGSQDVECKTMFGNCLAAFYDFNITYAGGYRNFINNTEEIYSSVREEDAIEIPGDSDTTTNPYLVRISNCNLESFIENPIRLGYANIIVENCTVASYINYLYDGFIMCGKVFFADVKNVEFVGTDKNYAEICINIRGTFNSPEECFSNSRFGHACSVKYNNAVYFVPAVQTSRFLPKWRSNENVPSIEYNVVHFSHFYKALTFKPDTYETLQTTDYSQLFASNIFVKKRLIGETLNASVTNGLYLVIDDNTEVLELNHYSPIENNSAASPVEFYGTRLIIQVSRDNQMEPVTLYSADMQGGFLLPVDSLKLAYGYYVFDKVYSTYNIFRWKLNQYLSMPGSSEPVLHDVMEGVPSIYMHPAYKDFYLGMMKFDAGKGRPIWYNGSIWVNALGERVVWGIEYRLQNLTPSNTCQPYVNEQYSTVLTANEGFLLPLTITVTMNGDELVAGTDYTYDNSTGEVVILGIEGSGGITGNIVIVADGAEE